MRAAARHYQELIYADERLKQQADSYLLYRHIIVTALYGRFIRRRGGPISA